MSELFEKQRLFMRLLGDWLVWVHARGYAITEGEAFRTPEQAALNAAKGTGIKNSLHTQRLAIDLNLFRKDLAGQWQYVSDGDSPDWKVCGEYWESLGGTWGGRFSKPDSNHLSVAFGGVK